MYIEANYTTDLFYFCFVFPPEVHAVLPTTGLLECGDVCHVRAAETGSDGGEPQIHKHPAVVISCHQFGLDQPPCFYSTIALAVRLALRVKLPKCFQNVSFMVQMCTQSSQSLSCHQCFIIGESLFDELLPLSRELHRKLDVELKDEVSSLGGVLRERHSLPSHHFLVRRAGVWSQTRHRQENNRWKIKQHIIPQKENSLDFF